MTTLRFYWLLLTMRIMRLQSTYLRYRYTVKFITYYQPQARFLLWGAALWPVLWLLFLLGTRL